MYMYVIHCRCLCPCRSRVTSCHPRQHSLRDQPTEPKVHDELHQRLCTRSILSKSPTAPSPPTTPRHPGQSPKDDLQLLAPAHAKPAVKALGLADKRARAEADRADLYLTLVRASPLAIGLHHARTAPNSHRAQHTLHPCWPTSSRLSHSSSTERLLWAKRQRCLRELIAPASQI
jgi:hypothetical protein